MPSDLAWRVQHRAGGRTLRHLRLTGAAARRHGWIVFPTAVELVYVAGAARLGTPSFADTFEQLAMATGAVAIGCGMVLLWRAAAPVTAAWIVCLGALAPTLLIARSAALSLLWAALTMRSAVRRSDELRAERRQAAST